MELEICLAYPPVDVYFPCISSLPELIGFGAGAKSLVGPTYSSARCDLFLPWVGVGLCTQREGAVGPAC